MVFQDHLVDPEGANDSHIRSFAHYALRDRTSRLRQPDLQHGINDLAAGRDSRIYGEAPLDDRVDAERCVGKANSEIRDDPGSAGGRNAAAR
jgi:hypothetical protein